jgi:hypothetical protein
VSAMDETKATGATEKDRQTELEGGETERDGQTFLCLDYHNYSRHLVCVFVCSFVFFIYLLLGSSFVFLFLFLLLLLFFFFFFFFVFFSFFRSFFCSFFLSFLLTSFSSSLFSCSRHHWSEFIKESCQHGCCKLCARRSEGIPLAAELVRTRSFSWS